MNSEKRTRKKRRTYAVEYRTREGKPAWAAAVETGNGRIFADSKEELELKLSVAGYGLGRKRHGTWLCEGHRCDIHPVERIVP